MSSPHPRASDNYFGIVRRYNAVDISPQIPMARDLMKLPSPCRSGRFCEMCRDESAGQSFRAQHAQSHPEMFGPDFVCAQGLPWKHRGPAPWAQQFAQSVREKVQSAAIAATAAAPTFGPGDVVKIVLARLGYRLHPNCGCDEFREQMNAWAWWGCIRHRAEIIEWFASKAREQGIAVDEHTIWSLIRGGMRDLLRQRRQARD